MTCYRLDAEIEPNQKSFTWQLDAAKAIGLFEHSQSWNEIGSALEAELNDGTRLRIPLMLGKAQGKKEASALVTIIPGKVLSSFSWSLRNMLSGEIERSQDLKGSYFPSSTPVAFGMPCSKDGSLRLELAAKSQGLPGGRSSAPVTRFFDLYFPCG